MKTLFILRHAKSSWGDADLADEERPLNGRGRRAATGMGRYLRDEDLLPDRVLCSTARRTVETLERLQREWPEEPPVRFDERLYLASSELLLSVLGEQEPGVGSLLLIGHNPGLAALAVRLAGAGDAEDLERLRRKLPTAALVEIAFDVDSWGDLPTSRGELRRFVVPRALSE